MNGKVARGGRGLTYLRHGTFKIDPETWIISVDYTFGFDWEFEALVHVFVDQMADLGLDHMWKDMPRIRRWYDEIRSHAAFKPTYYVGSLLTENFPYLRERAAKPN